MFSVITQSWRGRPLLSIQAVVGLIANTTTNTGSKIKAALDKRAYDTDVNVSDEQLPPSTCDQVASTATGTRRSADCSAQSERFPN